MPDLNGGQAVIATLKAEGVDTVFGIVSVHMLEIYNALYDEPAIRLRIPRHEQGAGFMADGYARTCGKPGVYFTSTGPGAFNSAGAVNEAWVASSPTLQITGQIPSGLIGQHKGYLHEAYDQQGVFASLGAIARRVNRVEEIPDAIHLAMEGLRSRRPQPVVLEIPIDVQTARAKIEIGPVAEPERLQPQGEVIQQAATMLRVARKPVIWAGGGVLRSGAWDELRQVAEELAAPVLMTRSGRGALPDDHPLALGNIARDPAVQEYLGQSDLLLAVGTRFSGSATGNWQLKLPPIIQIDLDPAELGRNYPVALGINADARAAFAALAGALQDYRLEESRRAEAERAVAQICELSRTQAQQRRPLLAGIMDTLRAAIERDAIVVADATIPTYFGTNSYLPIYAPRTYITPLSVAIGPGLPLALGAKSAAPEQQVVLVAGDGGFLLTAGELATAVQEELPVVILLFNNQGYGVLRNMQRGQYQGRLIGVDLVTPDYAALARSFGAEGMVVEQIGELGPALSCALAAKKPVLIEIKAEFE